MPALATFIAREFGTSRLLIQVLRTKIIATCSSVIIVLLLLIILWLLLGPRALPLFLWTVLNLLLISRVFDSRLIPFLRALLRPVAGIAAAKALVHLYLC